MDITEKSKLNVNIIEWKPVKPNKKPIEKYVIGSTLQVYLRFGKSGWVWVDDIRLATQFDNKEYALQMGRKHMKWKAGVVALKVRSTVEAVEKHFWFERDHYF